MEWYPEDTGEVSVSEEQLPGCCSVGVLYEAQYPNKEIFLRAMKDTIEDNSFECGSAGLMLYTLDESQKEERDVLLNAGFEELTSYHSPRSDKKVTLYGLKINQPKPKAAAKRRRR